MNTLNFTESTLRRTVLRAGIFAALLSAGLLSGVPAHGVPISGGSGASLSSIAGSPTLVTVILRGGAKDPNLQVAEVQGGLIVFTTDDGNRISYTKTDIERIEIQGSVVEKNPTYVPSTVALRPEEQRIVDGAFVRAAELFQNSKDNQGLRIRAAGLLAYNGNKEAAEYLNSLANSNNLQTRLDAALWGLYLADKPVPESLVRDGLSSNNRNLKAATAVIAGLYKEQDAISDLVTMLNDRSAQFSAPAAVALARLGHREIIPQLLDLIGSTSEEKNYAGMNGLVLLGGDDVIESVKYRIEETDGLERFRLIRVLHELGAPEARKHLIRVFNEELTIKPEAALILASDDYWEAIQYLQERLKRREDPTYDNLVYRARNAHAILQSGDMSAIHVFQSLLREDDTKIRSWVLFLIADLADNDLLKLIQPSIQNVDSGLSVIACSTAVAIASPEFRTHFQDVAGTP